MLVVLLEEEVRGCDDVHLQIQVVSAGTGVLTVTRRAPQHACFVGFSSQCGFFFFFLKLWGSELLGKLLFLYLLSLPSGVTFIPQVLILPGVARKLPPIPPGSGHGCRPLLGQGGGCPPPGAACLALMWHTWVMSWLQAVEPWPEGSFLSASSSTEIGLSMSMWGFRSHKSLL